MKNRALKVSLAGGLVLLLAIPAIAFSQFRSRERAGPGGDRTGQVGGAPPDRPFFARAQGRGRTASPGRARIVRRRAAAGGIGRRGDGALPIGVRRAGFVNRGELNTAAHALRAGDRIDLTPEQTEQLSAATRSFREASINRRAARQIGELELRELMAEESPDIAAVETKMREIAEQQIAEKTAALRLDAAAAEILTPAQAEALEQRPEDRDRARRGRRG